MVERNSDNINLVTHVVLEHRVILLTDQRLNFGSAIAKYVLAVPILCHDNAVTIVGIVIIRDLENDAQHVIILWTELDLTRGPSASVRNIPQIPSLLGKVNQFSVQQIEGWVQDWSYYQTHNGNAAPHWQGQPIPNPIENLASKDNMENNMIPMMNMIPMTMIRRARVEILEGIIVLQQLTVIRSLGSFPPRNYHVFEDKYGVLAISVPSETVLSHRDTVTPTSGRTIIITIIAAGARIILSFHYC